MKRKETPSHQGHITLIDFLFAQISIAIPGNHALAMTYPKESCYGSVVNSGVILTIEHSSLVFVLITFKYLFIYYLGTEMIARAVGECLF